MIVVGSGPAGLTAAYLMAKRGEKVIVVDKAKLAGGLWRGFDYTVSVPVNYGDATAKAEKIHFETGMHWYTDCGVPDIDAFWRCLPVERVEIPREIAGCFWDGRLQTNSPYPDVRGGKQFHNRPVLEKLWGVPLEHLAPNAGKLLKIERAVVGDEAGTLAAYRADPKSRDIIAWPDQRTLPEEYRSGAASFYPVAGMGALVDAAVELLRQMGVTFWLGVRPPFLDERVQTIWAAGIKSFADTSRITWPVDMTPPRRLLLWNAVYMPECLPDHDLHYALDYMAGPIFRTTYYRGFTGNPSDGRVSFEMLEEVKGIPTDGLMHLQKHDLGPVLPVPTIDNEDLLEDFRGVVAKSTPHVKLVGAGAKAGLFFQPEILRHVDEVCADYNPTAYYPV